MKLPASFTGIKPRIMQIVVCLMITCPVFAGAQAPQKKFHIKPGEVATKTIPFHEQYSNLEFKAGKILFVKGNTSTALLNFNLLYTEMEFIDPAGDTLAIGSEDLVKNVLLGEHLYYFDYRIGYLRLVHDFPSLKLVEKRGYTLVLRDNEKYVNPRYDHFAKLAEDSFSYQDRNNFNSYTYRQMYNQPAKDEFYLLESVSWFFIDKNERAHPASQKSLRKIFPENRSDIKKFIKDNNINLRDPEDLEKLVNYFHETEII